MNDNEAHMMPFGWLYEDAIRRGDVDLAEHFTRRISLLYLKEEHPDVYDMLMGLEKRALERSVQPQHIGQLVAKQDNNYMLGAQLENLLKGLLPKMTNDND